MKEQLSQLIHPNVFLCNLSMMNPAHGKHPAQGSMSRKTHSSNNRESLDKTDLRLRRHVPEGPRGKAILAEAVTSSMLYPQSMLPQSSRKAGQRLSSSSVVVFFFFYNRVRSSGELLPSSPTGVSSAGSILISSPKAELILPGEQSFLFKSARKTVKTVIGKP